MGYFRFILSVLVCANHLWIIGGVGRYAVFSFYILSGYLMTTIICDRYGSSLDGVKKYAINRFLRIYPTYLIVMTFTVLAIAIIGVNNTQAIDPNLSIPSTMKSWFMNTTLIGLDFSVKERTIPPSWTLFVELFFYAVIPLAVRLGAKFILLWLFLSIAYHAYFLFFPSDAGLDWNSRYGDIFAGSLGFSLGCAAKFLLSNSLKFKGALTIAILGMFVCYSATTYFMIAGYSQTEWRYISTLGFYLSMIFTVIFIANAISINQSRTDKFLGDLSYPLYLSHIPIGFVVISIMKLQPRTFESLIVSLFFSFPFVISLYLLDKNINKLRNKIRPSVAKSPT